MKASKKEDQKPKFGDCCPLFGPVIRRDVSREARRGFEVVTPFGIADGKPRSEILIYRFSKSKRGEPDKLEDATYAKVAFCPFCGAKQGLPRTEGAG